MFKKLLSLASIAIIIIAVSCSKMKDDTLPGGINNKTAATQSMETMSQDMANDMDDLMKSEGLQGMVAVFSLMQNTNIFPTIDLNGLTGGLGLKKYHTNQSKILANKLKDVITFNYAENAKTQKIKNYLSKKLKLTNPSIEKNYLMLKNKNKSDNNDPETEKFDFEKNKGIYKWDENKKEWIKVGSSNEIVMQFEYTDTITNTKNKGELTIHNFEEKEFVVEGKKQYIPTNINIDLLINNKKVAELTYYGMFDDNMIPKIINFNLYFMPYNLSINYYDKETSISFDLSLTEEGQIIIALGLNANFNTSDKFSNLANDTTGDMLSSIASGIETIDAYLQYRYLRYTLYANVANLAKYGDNIKASQINDNLIVELTNVDTGEVLAKLFAKDGEQGPELMVKLSDGSTMTIDEFLKNTPVAVK